MNDIESNPGDPRKKILRELHDALDLTEVHLKRIATFDREGARFVDLVVELRQRITTLGLPDPGEEKSPIAAEEDTARHQFSGPPHARGKRSF